MGQPDLTDRPVIIYGLVDPRTDEIRYVGRTVQRLSQRLGSHIANARRHGRKAPVYCWIRSLLDAGCRPLVVGLQQANGQTWEDAERVWISRLRQEGVRLTNLTEGGDVGSLGFKMPASAVEKTRQRSLGNTWGRLTAGKTRPPLSAKQRKQISETQRGRKRSPESRARMSAAQKGRTFGLEHRAKISATLTGYKHTDEARANMSTAGRGKPKPPGFGAKLSKARKGKPLSDSHRAALRAAWVRRKARMADSTTSLDRRA